MVANPQHFVSTPTLSDPANLVFDSGLSSMPLIGNGHAGCAISEHHPFPNITWCTLSVVCKVSMPYTLQTNSSADADTDGVRIPSPNPTRRWWFSLKTFHAVRFVCPHMYDVVSEPVRAWNGKSASIKDSGSWRQTSPISMYFLFWAVPVIIHTFLHSSHWNCATSNKITSVSRAHTTIYSWGQCSICKTMCVSASSWAVHGGQHNLEKNELHIHPQSCLQRQ